MARFTSSSRRRTNWRRGLQRALESASRRWSAAAEANPKDPLGAVVAFYLSMEHREEVDGCPVVALGADAARQGDDVKASFEAGIRNISRCSGWVGNADGEEPRQGHGHSLDHGRCDGPFARGQRRAAVKAFLQAAADAVRCGCLPAVPAGIGPMTWMFDRSSQRNCACVGAGGRALDETRAFRTPGERGILVLLAGLSALGALATNIILPAFPQIGAGLGVSSQELGLTLSSFFVAFAFGQLLVGPLSDRFGRKWLVLGGLAVFIAGSVLCAFAGTLPV